MQKCAVITGASSGIGAQIEKQLKALGYKTLLIARRFGVDVCDEAAVQKALAACSCIDVLVNCAGMTMKNQPFDETSSSDCRAVIDTNILGVLNCTHAVLPQMRAQNSGHIINIGSIAAKWPYKGGAIQASSKAFVQHFSEALRADLLGTNIRVSHVNPGIAGERPWLKKRPLSREEIAAAVVFLIENDTLAHANLDLFPVWQVGSHMID